MNKNGFYHNTGMCQLMAFFEHLLKTVWTNVLLCKSHQFLSGVRSDSQGRFPETVQTYADVTSLTDKPT